MALIEGRVSAGYLAELAAAGSDPVAIAKVVERYVITWPGGELAQCGPRHWIEYRRPQERKA